MRLAVALIVTALVNAPHLMGAPVASAQTPSAPPPAPRTPFAMPPAEPAATASTLSLQELLARPITVEEAVSFALEAQPQIQARLGDYAAARFRVSQAIAPLLPQLTGAWTAQRDQNVINNSAFAAQGTGSKTFWTSTTAARVSLSQILFDFGKTTAATEVARKNAEASFQSIELQRQQIVDSVKEAYTNIVFAQRLIQVQQQALQRADLNLRSATGFFEVGTQPRSVVTRAQVDVANAKVAIIQARNAESLARVALNTAMGIAANAPTRVIDNLAYAPISIDRSTLLREALSRRPEYRQAQLTTDAAEATLKQNFRNFFPSVTGGGFYGAARQDFNEIWELNVGLSWTLFDGGNLIGRYREARANLEAAQARVKATELSIGQQVEQAALVITEADERIQAAKVLVQSAQENFQLAQGRFDAGVGTILEVTDAQLALTQAQNTEAQALADFRIAQARLDLALGRR